MSVVDFSSSVTHTSKQTKNKWTRAGFGLYIFTTFIYINEFLIKIVKKKLNKSLHKLDKMCIFTGNNTI